MKQEVSMLVLGLFLLSFSGGNNFTITSRAFRNDGRIPLSYTCDGKNISPPLSWKAAPAGTTSFAIICDDPDAPMGTWVHWVAYNITPANTHLFPEFGKRGLNLLADGTRQGINSWGEFGYGGPCPPKGHGVHRYVFTIYALDTILHFGDEERVTKAMVLKAIRGTAPHEGHVLATTTLLGRYERKAKPAAN